MYFRLAVALCLILYAILFYLILKDAEEDRSKGPHLINYEIKHYPEWDRFSWQVWSDEHPEISMSGESIRRETAIRHVRRGIREVRDEIVYGTMEEDSGEVWI